MNLAVLASGGLGYETLKKVIAKNKVVAVLTDSKSDPIISLCIKHAIPCFRGNPRKGQAYEFLSNYTVDVLISINYLFLVEEDIINHPKILAFNIHGSLLPKYRGRTPHVWAIINDEKKAGITAHKIDVGCDTGDIIKQVEVPILSEDTGAIILEKYAEAYFPLVEEVLKSVEKQSIVLRKQDDSKATYFGKRTPNDGHINWNWSKERIKNWVRAQAYPYPGAFSFYEDQKICIDKATFSDLGFHSEIENGTIIKTSPELFIKVHNGVIKIEKIRTEKSITFEVEKKLI